MVPIHRESFFTFRFGDDRRIPRFHPEGLEPGQAISVFRMDPMTGDRQSLLTTGTVGFDGWVDLQEPIVVRAGDAFIACPD